MSNDEPLIIPASPSDAQLFISVMLECWRGSVGSDSTAVRETAETTAPPLT